jgi:hypothetical protein
MHEVKSMAYLRKEKETVETDFSLEKIWTAIQKALTSLEWDIEQIDEEVHHIEAKTRKSLMSWGSRLLIDAVSVDEKTTRVSIAAETPTTTITSIVDFGQTRRRISLFFAELAKQLAK